MKIKENLKNFYNQQANKFSQTRKKNWPEFNYILDEINNYPKNEIKILELGCGDGRLFGFLEKKLEKKINYTGVDLSDKLLEIGKKNYPNANFINQDMVKFLEKEENEKYDFIILVASFQHLPTEYERLLTLRLIYQKLKFGGKLILINWSFSRRFIKKFFLHILKSIFKSFFYLSKRNDLLIPWKNQNKVFYRFYHIFTLAELKKLIQLSSFKIKKAGYITNTGKIEKTFLNARNTYIVSEKTYF